MSNKYSYSTIESSSESLFKDRGSKHFGYAIPINSRNEISEHISNLRNNNSKANHVCHAWVLRENGETLEYSTDDGEPNNSAGPPILGQIKSSGLQNVLVAVVRYFGGTKLGVPGLINAYKTTAKFAIESATQITKEDSINLNIRYEYTVYNDIMRIIKEQKLTILQQENKANCVMDVAVPLNKKEEIDQQLKKIECNSLEWTN